MALRIGTGLTLRSKVAGVDGAPVIPIYTSWNGSRFDASDAASVTLVNTNQVSALADKGNNASNLAIGGTQANLTYVAAAQNGLSALRVARDASSSTSMPRLVSSAASALANMVNSKDDQPLVMIAVYKRTDAANTGFVAAWSKIISSTSWSLQGIVDRLTPNCSVRKYASSASQVDVSWGSGHVDTGLYIVAVRYNGITTDVWDTSLTKAVTAGAQDVTAMPSANEFALFCTRSGNAVSTAWNTVQMSLDFYELVTTVDVKTDVDIQAAITALSVKWGITLS